ncbi:MAG: L-histidine N(alpha)-methyltransferase [Acidobacteriaceae bacterium]|nr:L-histidine N(alpha)-methyltransferase [Acidobacteriaceae bacterium]
MAGLLAPAVTEFAIEVTRGLTKPGQKLLSPRYFYDDLGSALFEAITFLPEYGLTRADERLLKAYSGAIAERAGKVRIIAELGSGSGRKTGSLLAAIEDRDTATYYPIDVSPSALSACAKQLQELVRVQPVCSDWMDGLASITRTREPGQRMLLLFLGSSIGNIERTKVARFLSQLRRQLVPGDYFLLGADLVQDVDVMLAAYNDPTGVTAAFNLNLLGRINRELGGEFNLRLFQHEARWNPDTRAIEMHLVSSSKQDVYIGGLERAVHFEVGESIWTEASHKFLPDELDRFASESGFTPVQRWVDAEWPFAEALWEVRDTAS